MQRAQKSVVVAVALVLVLEVWMQSRGRGLPQKRRTLQALSFSLDSRYGQISIAHFSFQDWKSPKKRLITSTTSDLAWCLTVGAHRVTFCASVHRDTVWRISYLEKGEERRGIPKGNKIFFVFPLSSPFSFPLRFCVFCGHLSSSSFSSQGNNSRRRKGKRR